MAGSDHLWRTTMSGPFRILPAALLLVGAGGFLYLASSDRLGDLWRGVQGWVNSTSGPLQETWCPMDPQVVRKGPGMCPICNMELVPREAGAAGSAEAGVLVLSSRQIQQSGVRLGTARQRDLVREIDATGRLQINPAKRRSLPMPFPGTSVVREVHVQAAGAQLNEGQVVLEVHNPIPARPPQDYREVLASIVSTDVISERQKRRRRWRA